MGSDELERSPQPYENKLSRAEYCKHNLNGNKNTLDKLEPNVDETETKLKSCGEHVHFLDGRIFDRKSQRFSKDAAVIGPKRQVFCLTKIWHICQPIWVRRNCRRCHWRTLRSRQHCVRPSRTRLQSSVLYLSRK